MRSVTVMVLALTAVLAVLVPASPAAAHGQLAMSDPVADSTLQEPRPELKLYFTEQPASFAWFTVTAPSGQRVDGGWRNGEPKRLDKPVQEYFLVDGKFEPKTYHTGFPAVLTVSHWPEQGVYVAAYQSVASDGEAVKGTLKFSYAGAVTPPPAGWTPPVDGPSAQLTAALAGDAPQQAFPTATAGPAVPGAQPEAAAPPAPFVLTDWLIPGAIVAGVAVMIAAAARRAPVPVAKKRRRAARG